MVKNCGPQILKYLLDTNCQKALQCLKQCSHVDQVCSYRYIASSESPYFEAFSLCGLQKQNCLELDAKIPEKFKKKKKIPEKPATFTMGWCQMSFGL